MRLMRSLSISGFGCRLEEAPPLGSLCWELKTSSVKMSCDFFSRLNRFSNLTTYQFFLYGVVA